MSEVERIKASAIEGAHHELMHNYIHCTRHMDGTAVDVWMHVDGADKAWVTFDAQQLDNLIEYLRHCRSLIR